MKLGKINVSISAFILSLIFVAIFLYPRLNTYTSPFERDEGEYAYSAWIFRQGRFPYENSFLQKPPLIIYAYMAGQLFDQGVVAPRVISTLFILVTTVLLGLIAKREFGASAGWVAVFISVPLFLIPFNTPFAANTENLIVLPLVSLLYIYLKSKIKANNLHFFLGGVVSALTLLFKPIGIPIILYIFFVWFLEIYKHNSLKRLVINFSYAFLGGLLTTLIVLMPFIVGGKLDYVYESVFLYNLTYSGFEGFRFFNIVNYIGGRYIKYYWPLYILLIYFIYQRPQRWWFYLGLFVSSLVSVYSSPMGHYYILVIPFWVLLSAYALSEAVKKLKFLGLNFYIRGIVASMVLVIIFIYPFRMQPGLAPEQQSTWMYGNVNPFVDAYYVGNFVRENTHSDDYIFVAGSEPEIYYYAKRMSPTRFVITYPLNISSNVRESYQNETVDALKKTPPKVIVVSKMAHSGLWNEGSPTVLVKYLDEILDKEYQIEGLYLWVRNKGYFLTEYDDSQLNNASLVVYRKV